MHISCSGSCICSNSCNSNVSQKKTINKNSRDGTSSIYCECNKQKDTMASSRNVKWRKDSKLIATRRTIQHEYLRMLNESNFSFLPGAKEPHGLQRKVMRSVNEQFYGNTRMKTTPQQVSEWVRRVRENNYDVTSCKQDYTQSSQNSRLFHDAEQKRIRDFMKNETLECTEIESIWSDKKT